MFLTIGTVENNYDKNHPCRILVKMNFYHSDGTKSEWLPVMSAYAGNGYGSCFIPEIGDAVVVGFINNDVNTAVVLGSYWNEKNKAPVEFVNKNNDIKSLKTKSGHNITFNDNDKGSLTIKTKNDGNIEINDEHETITLSCKTGKNKITINEKNGQISIEADKEISLKSNTGNISIAGNKIEMNGKSLAFNSDGEISVAGKMVKLKGSVVNINGDALSIKGNKTDVESSSLLTLKGSMIKMN